MGNIKLLRSPFLKKIFYSSLDFFLSFKKCFRKVLELFIKSKYFDQIKDCLFVFFLCVVPIVGILAKDYISDHLEATRAQYSIEEFLISSLENYAQIFSHLRDKILTEELYDEGKKLHHLLMDLDQLRVYSKGPSMKRPMGLRWVAADLKAMGPYGNIQNFNSKDFLPFLRSLEQMPDTVQITTINNQVYVGMGIKEGKDLRGYLLLPIYLEINNQLNSLRTVLLKFNSKFELPFIAIPLDKLIKEHSSFLKTHKKVDWFNYFTSNFIAYVIFLLFAFILLILKKKKETQKEYEAFESQKKILSLSKSLLAQQKTANLMVTHLHDGVVNVNEISKLLLEAQTHSHANVFSEKEKIRFVKKIYETSLTLEEPIIKKGAHEEIDIHEIVNQCLNFYAYKIEEEDIKIKKDYSLSKSSVTSYKDSFYQLMLNLFHQALERTPEQGSILIKMREAKEIKDCLYILTIEDSGYSFPLEELTSFKKQNQNLFESYFDLEWEKILYLAEGLKIKISLENISPTGNRITLQVYNHKIFEEESSYGDNIVRLFPVS